MTSNQVLLYHIAEWVRKENGTHAREIDRDWIDKEQLYISQGIGQYGMIIYGLTPGFPPRRAR